MGLFPLPLPSGTGLCAGQALLLQWDMRGQVPVPCPIGIPSIPHPFRALPLLRTLVISASVPRLRTLGVANAHHFPAFHIFGVSSEPKRAS